MYLRVLGIAVCKVLPCVCVRACPLRARGVTGSGQETWRGVSSKDPFHSGVSFTPPCGPSPSSLNHQQKMKVIIATNLPTGLRNPWADLRGGLFGMTRRDAGSESSSRRDFHLSVVSCREKRQTREDDSTFLVLRRRSRALRDGLPLARARPAHVLDTQGCSVCVQPRRMRGGRGAQSPLSTYLSAPQPHRLRQKRRRCVFIERLRVRPLI